MYIEDERASNKMEGGRLAPRAVFYDEGRFYMTIDSQASDWMEGPGAGRFLALCLEDAVVYSLSRNKLVERINKSKLSILE